MSSHAMSIDLSRSRVAVYLQLATLFRNWIASRRWPVGGRIPNVDQLALDFEVARGTIREALTVLEKEGLLVRYRAKGTFVRGAPAGLVSHSLETDWKSLIMAHQGADIRTLSSKTLNALPDGLSTEGTPAGKYQMMRRVHSRDGHPYLLGTFYLDYEIYRMGSPAQFRRKPTLPILHDIAAGRIGRAKQRMTVGMADVETAGLLQMPLNSPVANVSRIAFDKRDVILYIGLGIYRGDTVQLDINLR